MAYLAIRSVSELASYLRTMLQSDDLLSNVWVRGEVSNYSMSQAGHSYFTLKDSEAQVQCVLFGSRRRESTSLPSDGMAVLAHGHVSFYEVSGRLQFIVDVVRPEGEGELFVRFELLRQQLAAEGLFEPDRKRRLPVNPRRIGVVTSLTGAALQDIVKVIRRRYAGIELFVAPTLVQGEAAVDGICSALTLVQQVEDLDLVIVARGGGSLEDLWPFNEERVARAIFSCRVPVVSGVGHETDTTIADLVADVRAATPSMAAELSVPDREALRADLAGLTGRLQQFVVDGIDDRRNRLSTTSSRLRSLTPESQLERWRLSVDDKVLIADRLLAHGLSMRRERLRGMFGRLVALNPRAVLNRGYSMVKLAEAGTLVSRVEQIAGGEQLVIEVSNGSFAAKAYS